MIYYPLIGLSEASVPAFAYFKGNETVKSYSYTFVSQWTLRESAFQFLRYWFGAIAKPAYNSYILCVNADTDNAPYAHLID